MENNNRDRMLRLLKEIAEMSEEASLTGSLQGGGPQAVERYNAVLNYFVEHGEVPKGLFSPLPVDTPYGKLGVESRLLRSYFKEPEGSNKFKGKDGVDASLLVRLAPFVDKGDLADLVAEYTREGGGLDTHILTALAPFLEKSSLGLLIRGHLKRGDREEGSRDQGIKDQGPRTEERASSTEERGSRIEDRGQRELVPQERTGLETYRPKEPEAPKPSLEDLAVLLRRNNLSPEERQTIAIQLAEIAHEQSFRPNDLTT